MHTCITQSNHFNLAGADKSVICPRCGKLHRIGTIRVSVDIDSSTIDGSRVVDNTAGGLNNPEVMPEVNGRGIMAHPTGGMYNSPECWEHSDPLVSFRCPSCKIECIEVDTSIARLCAALQRWKFYVKTSSGDTMFNWNMPGAFITLYGQWPAFLLNAMTWNLLPAEKENLQKMCCIARQTSTLHFNTTMTDHIWEYCDKMAYALMDDRNPYLSSLVVYANTVGAYYPSLSTAHMAYAIHCIGPNAEAPKKDHPILYSQLNQYFSWLADLQGKCKDLKTIGDQALAAVAANYQNREGTRKDMPDPAGPSLCIPIAGTGMGKVPRPAINETSECG